MVVCSVDGVSALVEGAVVVGLNSVRSLMSVGSVEVGVLVWTAGAVVL